MTKAKLLSTVAAALLFGAGAAYAQAPAKDQAPAQPAPAAQQKAPPEKVAPTMKAGDNARPNAAKPDADHGKTAQSGDHKPDAKADAKGSADPKKADIKTNADANKRADDAKPDAKRADDAKPDAKRADDAKPAARSTTGQGAAGAAAKLSTEQRTKITTIIRDKKVEPVRLNVSINVGTRITENVRYYPLPTEVITIYPEWRGYDYILVGNQVIVVDPGTHEIVAILDA